MYIMLWLSFIHQIKTALQTVVDNNKTDGPALLYHLICQYRCTAKLGTRTYQLSLNNLLEKLKEFGFDIGKFYNYMFKMLKILHDAGGNDKQTPLKLYKALVLTKVDDFSSEIRA
eukprot:15367100-Ditylum_brightwellii.AAC.1